ncbi:MAG TPA: adenylate/guanylate cyclase domain-containing protein [Baekduia sp.]
MELLPLPEHPVLRAAAEQLEERRQIAEIWDARWRLAYMTGDYLLSSGTTADAARPGLGIELHAPATTALRTPWPGFATTESWLALLARLLPAIAYDLPGGVAELRDTLVPELADTVDGLVPRRAASLTVDGGELKVGRRTAAFQTLTTRVLDETGELAGMVSVITPALSGSVLSLLGTSDHRSLERLLDISQPARRRGAVLFADLEGSSALARRLPTAEYFRLIRRLMSRMDAEIVERGGLVGKHAGDGLSALFLADQVGSESAAVRGCVETVRAIRDHTADVASRSGLAAEDVVLRFGLHWGATLYVGSLLTSGRTDVTALGDEMNEAARIEASAAGGRTLASKALIERLDADDAARLHLDVAGLRFTPIAELTTAPEKAQRDASWIAVCEL